MEYGFKIAETLLIRMKELSDLILKAEIQICGNPKTMLKEFASSALTLEGIFAFLKHE